MSWLSEHRIDRSVEGPAVVIGGRTVRLVARVTGWRWPGGLVASMAPLAVEVVAADGRRERMAIATTPSATVPLLVVAALVAVVGSLARRAIQHGRR